MQAYARKSGPQLLVATGLVLTGVVLGFLVGRGTASPAGSDLALQATPIPTSTPAPSEQPAPTPRPSRPTPDPGPTAAAPSPSAGTSGRPDAAAVVAIWGSLDRLRELRAYRFTLGLSGVSPLHLEESSNGSIGVRGNLVQKPAFAIDAVFATQLVEFGGAASVSNSQRFVIVGDTYWEPRPSESPAARPVGTTLDELRTLLPEGMATRLIIPFAAGFEQVGIETRRGIDTIHYRMTRQGEHVYASATGCVGDWSGDVWIIEDGRYLGEAELRCSPTDPSSRSSLQMQFQVTDVDDPSIQVEPPS